MANDYSKSTLNDPQDDLKLLLKALGNYIRLERERAGYANATEFSNLIDVAESQYREYERGETDMKLSTLLKILKGLNMTKKDVFAFNLFSSEGRGPTNNNDVRFLETQVRHQVSIATTSKYEKSLTSLDINRMCKMMIYCFNPRSRQEIIKYLGLASKTANFQQLFQLLLNLKWIEMNSPQNPNTPRQRYFTTILGKQVVQIK